MAKSNRHKVTRTEYLFFRDECLKWMRRLGLLDWKAYWLLEPFTDCIAQVDMDCDERVATFFLNVTLPQTDKSPRELIRSAAHHEVLHLRLARLQKYCNSRFGVLQDDVNEEVEAIVRGLQVVLEND